MSLLDLPGFEEFLTLPTPFFCSMEGVNCGENHISSENMPLSRARTHPGRSRVTRLVIYNKNDRKLGL